MAKDTAPNRSDSSERSQADVGTDSNRAGAGSSAERRTPFLLYVIPEIVLLAVSSVLFVLAFSFEYVSQEGSLGPGFWPKVISAGIAACALITFAQKLLDYRRPMNEAAKPEATEVGGAGEEENAIYWPRVALGIGLVVAYPLATIFVGYPLATALLLIIFLYLGGQRKWYIVPIGALGSLLFTYVFSGVVYVSLPYGLGIFGNFTNVLYQLLGLQ